MIWLIYFVVVLLVMLLFGSVSEYWSLLKGKFKPFVPKKRFLDEFFTYLVLLVLLVAGLVL